MPDIVEQRVTKDEIYIKSSSGSEFTLTRSAIKDHFQNETGNAIVRKERTMEWIKDQILASLGPTVIEVRNVIVDVNVDDDNEGITLEITS